MAAQSFLATLLVFLLARRLLAYPGEPMQPPNVGSLIEELRPRLPPSGSDEHPLAIASRSSWNFHKMLILYKFRTGQQS